MPCFPVKSVINKFIMIDLELFIMPERIVFSLKVPVFFLFV